MMMILFGVLGTPIACLRMENTIIILVNAVVEANRAGNKVSKVKKIKNLILRLYSVTDPTDLAETIDKFEAAKEKRGENKNKRPTANQTLLSQVLR